MECCAAEVSPSCYQHGWTERYTLPGLARISQANPFSDITMEDAVRLCGRLDVAPDVLGWLFKAKPSQELGEALLGNSNLLEGDAHTIATRYPELLHQAVLHPSYPQSELSTIIGDDGEPVRVLEHPSGSLWLVDVD